MTHRELSKQIRKDLGQANKSLNTAKRFGNTTFYHSGENKLRHAASDIRSVGSYRISRRSALRHAIGFSGRRPHPVGCNCPYHAGHRKKRSSAMKGVGRSGAFRTAKRSGGEWPSLRTA